MKANELRIGNKLQKTNGEIFTVSRLDNTKDVQVTEERGLLTLGYNLIGIPLTDEWLEFLGAERDHDCYVYRRFKFLWKPKYKYWYVLDLSSLTYMTKMEFVHEFQNFIFVMDGKEITLKKDMDI